MKAFIPIVLMTTATIAQTVQLDQRFDLAGDRLQETQYFSMKSHYIKYTQDGDRTVQECYKILLSCRPGLDSDLFTCHRFSMTLQDGKEKQIPALKNWSYIFNPGEDGLDESGQVFGIPHDKFEDLATDDGEKVDQEHSYAVYNCFIDFHGFNNAFSRPMKEGNGIEDLHYIGDRIIHDASHTEPPVNLGSNVEAGSIFRNGEVIMQFKGLSRVNDNLCALVGFDSGESSFTMKIKAMPDMIVETNGSSHYFGDLYVDLDSYWLVKAEMAEFVVSETDIPSMNMKVPGIIERMVTISDISEKELKKMVGE